MEKEIKIYPANKEFFKKLIPFAKEIILICKKNKIKPVIYGSFAHFYHTQDEQMKVNDIDLLIPKKDLPKLAKRLGRYKIKFRYLPKWNILIINKGKLKIEVDAISFWYNDLNENSIFKNFDKISFYGIDARLMSLKSLEKLYLIAYKRTDDNKLKVKNKIKHLEKFLGRR